MTLQVSFLIYIRNGGSITKFKLSIYDSNRARLATYHLSCFAEGYRLQFQQKICIFFK